MLNIFSSVEEDYMYEGWKSVHKHFVYIYCITKFPNILSLKVKSKDYPNKILMLCFNVGLLGHIIAHAKQQKNKNTFEKHPNLNVAAFQFLYALRAFEHTIWKAQWPIIRFSYVIFAHLFFKGLFLSLHITASFHSSPTFLKVHFEHTTGANTWGNPAFDRLLKPLI